MDSGSSGSTQSSSGGEEEYDSRADCSFSAFFNSHNQPPSHHHHQPPQQTHFSSSMFDPLSNFFDPLSRSAQQPPPLPFTNPNLDMVWSKTRRSESDHGGFAASASSPTQPFVTVTDQSHSRVAFPSDIQIPHRPDNASKGTAINNDHSSPNTVNSSSGTNMVRNPRKRCRASRRAPTTVLTTDTTNFRAMVQEFTGIPDPPFTSSSPFPRTTRFDLFGTSSISSSSSHPPPYLLRPFAQKLQPLPTSFLSSSSSSSSSSIADHAIASVTELTNSNINSSTSAAPSNSTSNINYQLLNNINMQLQNPVLNFQSLLNQAPFKYNPQSNSSILGTTQQESLQINPSNDDSHLKMGVLEEFGLSSSTTHFHGLQNIVSSSSDTALPRREINNGDPAKWVSGDGVGSSKGYHHQQQQHQALLDSVNGNNPQRVVNSNGKLDYLGTGSSDFHGDKGTDQNVVTRNSEGTVGSWICSSD